MQTKETLTTLAEELLRIADIPKCQGCSCYLDVLDQFRQATTSHSLAGHPTDQIGNLIENFQVTHGCLGCDPCYPVPIANALAELGAETLPCGLCHSERSEESRPDKRTASRPWPPEPGEYIIGSNSAPVAISTLASRTLPAAVSQELGTEHFALIGITETENIGVEKVVKNIISNPNIRFLFLCGQESRGHFSGQTFLALYDNGLDRRSRVIGSRAGRPFLRNLRPEESETFQRQVALVDLIGNEDPAIIAEHAGNCARQSPGAFYAKAQPKTVPRLFARPPKKFSPDKAGFFVILLDRQAGRIVLEHYANNGARTLAVEGHDAASIYSTAIEHHLLSRLDHAAYLGKELARAEMALRLELDYEQDSAPGKE